MNWLNKALTSSIGKKIVMALTGLFLISFLIVHASVNATIFYDDHGEIFTICAHFMATNPIIRTIEIVLVLGFIVHIIQGLMLWWQNKKARPVKYAYKDNSGSTWYSRSMALLGTLILLFLVIHTSNFWIPNRINQFRYGEELPLYDMMLEKFSSPFEVLIYLAGCFSLCWHLIHGFASAFQSMGWRHVKYNRLISVTGILFSIIVSVTLAAMPVAIYLRWLD
ncbi:succinate dehydrogenase cytochrome b subunit [Pedobacter sp.]|uniref:succinate dehydrogenase cytochrome b subunit n=1 Tax=Pedobacter sp. TaxID=1411316 RepID=UPI003C5F94D6